MKCSICDNKRRSRMVYCSMCQSWHCVAHFNSALIYHPDRALRSPLILHGWVEVHGDIVEATYQGAQLRLLLAKIAMDKYLVKSGGNTIGMVKTSEGPVLSWDAYIDETLVGQRQTVAGAVGCVIDGAIAC